MKSMLLSVTLLLSVSLAAQTVYYDHPPGIRIPLGGASVTVAQLTLPAGTYQVISKVDFNGPIAGRLMCSLMVTGIPNVPSPYPVDRDWANLTFGSSSDAAGRSVLEGAFYTAGGTAKVVCFSWYSGGAGEVHSAYINLSAQKISTLKRQ